MKLFLQLLTGTCLSLSLVACTTITHTTTESHPVDSNEDTQKEIRGDYYAVKGKAQIGSSCPASGIHYTGKIDSLNRIGVVCGVITKEMLDKVAGHREPWQEGSNPAGWGHNGEVDIQMNDGRTYHGWFWNKSHLLANSLGGEASFRNNIAGTRMQNVGAGHGGMAFTEGQVRDFIRSHPQATVIYQVTPKYHGNEVIPRTVLVDVKSSDGSIDEHVVTYNKVAGYSIDYISGTYRKN